MSELRFVGSFVLFFGTVSLGANYLSEGLSALVDVQALLGALTALTIAVEAVYFALLGRALKRQGDVPERWYARSFEHHERLTQRQRWLVLPFFYIGVLCLLLGLSIAVAMVVAGLRFWLGS